MSWVQFQPSTEMSCHVIDAAQLRLHFRCWTDYRSPIWPSSNLKLYEELTIERAESGWGRLSIMPSNTVWKRMSNVWYRRQNAMTFSNGWRKIFTNPEVNTRFVRLKSNRSLPTWQTISYRFIPILFSSLFPLNNTTTDEYKDRINDQLPNTDVGDFIVIENNICSRKIQSDTMQRQSSEVRQGRKISKIRSAYKTFSLQWNDLKSKNTNK